MKGTMVVQARTIGGAELELINELIKTHPAWHRKRLSRELCERWHWRRADGQLKDMACRSMLLKLHRAGYIQLPPPRRPPTNGSRGRNRQWVTHSTNPIDEPLNRLAPLLVDPVAVNTQAHRLFTFLLDHYHYLSYRTPVGENLKYLVYDRFKRPLACLLFGSAAWKTKPRDTFIGWDDQTRERGLMHITNNMRFLILPWVRVPHLASHVLSRISRRIRAEWIAKYGHPIYLLETFVDRSRFRGTCYSAANWILVGQTKGRSRNDRYSTMRVPIKDIYLYPLIKNFRRELCDADA